MKISSKLIFTIALLLFLAVLLPFNTEAAQVQVAKKSINIYEKPDPDSRIIARAANGMRLDVKGMTEQWYKIAIPKGDNETTFGYVLHSDVKKVDKKDVDKKLIAQKKIQEKKKKDKFFLMGMGMLRLNFADVAGDEIRFRYSDLGLPTDFSTRERASFMVDGTFGGGKYSVNGHVNYDPENRITEPPLEFLLNAGNENLYLSAGDYRMGVMLDSVFSRYYHPFRGGILGTRNKRLGIEVLGGLSRGESGIEELSADAGSGPYYLSDSPILRGSEVIYLVTKSSTNPDLELKRTTMVRNRDYFMDYDRGSILFSYSIYPYDELGNPVSILVSYQFESLVGRFARAVFGLRAFAAPTDFLKFNFSYIADADKDQGLEDIFDNHRGIYTFGVNVDSEPVTFFGEFSFSSDPGTDETNSAYFGGGIVNISKKIRLFFNGWKLDEEFPTFANKQLQYGYSLFQIFPTYAERNIFLSPFQFTRNLGAELYPFSLARLTVDETEMHGFLEYEGKNLKVSTGYGTRKEDATDLRTNTVYVSSFYNTEGTKAWGKVGMDATADADKAYQDSGITDILLGVRQRIKKFSHGEIFVQADFKNDWFTDYLELQHDTYHQTYSVMAEYLTGREGVFAGYRKDSLKDKDTDAELLNADIYEMGIRRHIYKGFFLDSRYRREQSDRDGQDTNNEIIALGAGWESKRFRAMGRYEIQNNRTGDNEGKRTLWSFYFFGQPVKRMSLNLRYYSQTGKDEAPLSLTERSEDQLSLRFLWRPWDFLNLYSQWRYDTNLELYPPLASTRSNSMAQVHGVKLTFTKRLEFLANYKLLKVWGPIDNRKYSAAAELGYLLFRHFRLGAGVELIDFQDDLNPDANYRSTVGYLKLVAIY